jgi:hypothetical protein
MIDNQEFVARLCVGGPADGKYRLMQVGCKHMQVAEMPNLQTTPYDSGSAKASLNDCMVKTHSYYLAISKRHGFVWVHEEYKGVIE